MGEPQTVVMRTATGMTQAITPESLQEHFNMPMADAAKAFGVCLTFFKKVCRKMGIKRWPHRKLKSLRNKLADLHTHLEDKQDSTNVHAKEYRRQLEQLCTKESLTRDFAADESQAQFPADGLTLLSSQAHEDKQLDENTPCSSEPVNLSPTVPLTLTGARHAKAISYEQLQKHFGFPMAQAAKNFGVSLTLFKKICRKNGIKRWPHRRIKSLQTKMIDLQNRLDTTSPMEGQDAELRLRMDDLASSEAGVLSTSASCCNNSEEMPQWSPEEVSSVREDEEDEEEIAAICLGMLAKQKCVSSDQLSAGSVL